MKHQQQNPATQLSGHFSLQETHRQFQIRTQGVCFAFEFRAFDTVITDSNINSQTTERLTQHDIKLYIV